MVSPELPYSRRAAAKGVGRWEGVDVRPHSDRSPPKSVLGCGNVGLCFRYGRSHRYEGCQDCLRPYFLELVDRRRCSVPALVHPDVRGVVHHRHHCRREKLSRHGRGEPLEPSQFQDSLQPLDRGFDDVLSVLEFSVHDDPEDLDVLPGPHLLSFDGEGCQVGFVRFVGKVNDGCLVRFECRATPSFLCKGVGDKGFYPFAIAFRRRTCDPRCKVVHKGDGTPVAIDPPLYQIRIKEEELQTRSSSRRLA